MGKDLHSDSDRLRCYSSVFSRNAFENIISYNDFSRIDWVFQNYDIGTFAGTTYNDYVKYIYGILTEFYRSEYVYKTALIDKFVSELRRTSGLCNAVAFNEFKVGNSIADIAFFNGESKAYEIKSDLDSPKRLCKQMKDYREIFDKCYIVIPKEKYELYKDIVEDEIGIILLSNRHGSISVKEIRPAQKNHHINSDILMECLRTEEYKTIITSRIGALPDVPAYMLYDVCKELMKSIPEKYLKVDFRNLLKQRKKNLSLLSDVPYELRQICLALGLTEKLSGVLISRLNQQLN